MPSQVCSNHSHGPFCLVFLIIHSNCDKKKRKVILLRCSQVTFPVLLFFLLLEAETFDPKKFFELIGMRAMSAENVKKVFQVLDVDGSGFIEEEELK